MPKQDDAMKILSRTGRLGQREVLVPDDPALLKKYGLSQDVIARYSKNDDTIYIHKKFDTPKVGRHELTHRGQVKFLKKHPVLSDLYKSELAPGASMRKLVDAGYSAFQAPYEWPAYQFEDPMPEKVNGRGNDFYRYIDLVRKLNPQQTSEFEAHLPQDYLEQMIRTRPMPNYFPLPQVQQDQRNIWDVIKEMVK